MKTHADVSFSDMMCKAKRVNNGKWVEGYFVTPSVHWHSRGTHDAWVVCGAIQNGGFFNLTGRYAVDPSTVCRCTGKTIFPNENTNKESIAEPLTVWQDDLIAIDSIHYDDNDAPIKNRVAVVRAAWDKDYKMLFAECVEGSMSDVVQECDVSCLDPGGDIPFAFWLEFMENASSEWWEWEIIGNAHDHECAALCEKTKAYPQFATSQQFNL